MSAIQIAFLVISLIIIIVILLQQRSSGLGSAFGGDDAVFTSRRGAERSLYRLTILLGIIFIALGLYLVYLQRPPKPAATTDTTATPAASTTDTTATPAADTPTTNQ